MSTNHTPNFNLSQWELTDKVLMDDFNADNAKIDAAFFNHPSAELIVSTTVEESEDPVYNVRLDISQVDWSRYFMLILTASSSTPCGFEAYIGSGSERCVSASSLTNTLDAHSSLGYFFGSYQMGMVIPVLYDSGRLPVAIGAGIGKSNTSSELAAYLSGGGGSGPLKNCRNVSLRRTNGAFQAGDRVEVWGVK